MASLRDMVSEYQDDLRNGIAWLAFWREGRSWQAEAFHLDLDDTLYPEDRARLAEIQAADPRAVVVNGYYSGYLGEEMNVAELAAGVVRWLCRSSWMLTVLLVVLASSALTAAGDIRISYCLAYI